ncbi:MAG: phage integrase N-terminal SAM-like domain-containing protein [Roseiflexaceae bacterium]
MNRQCLAAVLSMCSAENRFYLPAPRIIFSFSSIILFHAKRHLAALGVDEVWAFLAYLAVDRHVAVSTQTVALSALLFLYR